MDRKLQYPSEAEALEAASKIAAERMARVNVYAQMSSLLGPGKKPRKAGPCVLAPHDHESYHPARIIERLGVKYHLVNVFQPEPPAFHFDPAWRVTFTPAAADEGGAVMITRQTADASVRLSFVFGTRHRAAHWLVYRPEHQDGWAFRPEDTSDAFDAVNQVLDGSMKGAEA